MSQTTGEFEAHLQELAEHVRRLCRAKLEKDGHYLVSKLGLDLEDRIGILKQARVKLIEFVRERLGDEVEVIGVGKHGNVYAIVRRAAPDAVQMAREAVEHHRPPKSRNRFNRRFWGAFAVPLVEGIRTLDRRTFLFSDAPGTPEDGDGYLISPDYVAPEEIEDRDEIIKNNIERWLRDNHLDAGPFLAGSDEAPRGATGRPDESAGQSLLDALMKALDRRQQASVSLPLDVIASLMRTRVRN